MRGSARHQSLAGPLALKRSCASLSRRGLAGRAYCREKPRRHSTRVMLGAW